MFEDEVPDRELDPPEETFWSTQYEQDTDDQLYEEVTASTQP